MSKDTKNDGNIINASYASVPDSIEKPTGPQKLVLFGEKTEQKSKKVPTKSPQSPILSVTPIPEPKSKINELKALYPGYKPLMLASDRMKLAKDLPDIKRLFGNIWLSGELHICFADQGAGKSILGMMKAVALSEGRKVFPYFENDFPPLRVGYYDCELGHRQFFKRFSFDKTYNFNNNLFIDNIDFRQISDDCIRLKKEFLEVLMARLRMDIQELQLDIMFIDNLSYLSIKNTADPQAALDLIRELDSLKRETGISIECEAHTPKYDYASPMTVNDMAGSKILANMVDSISCIGKSCKGNNWRYLKQVKGSRNAEILLDTSNVLSLRIDQDAEMLRFFDEGFCHEMEHLAVKGKKDDRNSARKIEAIEIYKECKNINEVARQLKISTSTAHAWITEFRINQNESNAPNESNESNAPNESNESNEPNEIPF